MKKPKQGAGDHAESIVRQLAVANRRLSEAERELVEAWHLAGALLARVGLSGRHDSASAAAHLARAFDRRRMHGEAAAVRFFVAVKSEIYGATASVKSLTANLAAAKKLKAKHDRAGVRSVHYEFLSKP